MVTTTKILPETWSEVLYSMSGLSNVQLEQLLKREENPYRRDIIQLVLDLRTK